MSQSAGQQFYASLRDDARYVEFFVLFNNGKYFEAHEVLEALWLPVRGTPHADFFKGLIQLAGAFVHEQKGRIQSAVALLRLTKSNLSKYSALSFGINTERVIGQVESWVSELSTPGVVRVSSRPVLALPYIPAES